MSDRSTALVPAVVCSFARVVRCTFRDWVC